MSLKHKEEITIWAFKDGKKGHEKQIEALIHELSKRKKVNTTDIDCSTNFKDWPKNITVTPNILVAAGNKTHHFMLQVKDRLKTPKTIVLMRPSFKPTQLFDCAIVPENDRYLLYTPKNVLRSKGVLCKYFDKEPILGNGTILIGGNSRHFSFSQKLVSQQLKLILDKFPKIQWKVSTSPRSPNFKIPDHKGNAEFFNWMDVEKDWLSNQMSQSEYIIVTPESVSGVYEALSTNSKVLVMHLDKRQAQYGQVQTKVTKNIDFLKMSGEIGYISVIRKGIFGKLDDVKIHMPKKRKILKESKRIVDILMEII